MGEVGRPAGFYFPSRILRKISKRIKSRSFFCYESVWINKASYTKKLTFTVRDTELQKKKCSGYQR